MQTGWQNRFHWLKNWTGPHTPLKLTHWQVSLSRMFVSETLTKTFTLKCFTDKNFFIDKNNEVQFFNWNKEIAGSGTCFPSMAPKQFEKCHCFMNSGTTASHSSLSGSYKNLKTFSTLHVWILVLFDLPLHKLEWDASKLQRSLVAQWILQLISPCWSW